MFHVLFISPFSDNIVPLSLASRGGVLEEKERDIERESRERASRGSASREGVRVEKECE